MTGKRGVTAEELWDMPDVPGKRLELINGEVVELPGSGALQSLIATTLLRLLHQFVEEQDLGLVFPDGLGYVLQRNPDHLRIPNISFIAWDRVPEGEVTEWFWEGAPTLAVEIVSPDDRAVDLRERIHDYLNAGSAYVWVLWPRQHSVSVYLANGKSRELGPDAMLEAQDILPGFSVRVSDLFDVQRRR
jgi:Uma2 family endonuclease